MCRLIFCKFLSVGLPISTDELRLMLWNSTAGLRLPFGVDVVTGRFIAVKKCCW